MPLRPPYYSERWFFSEQESCLSPTICQPIQSGKCIGHSVPKTKAVSVPIGDQFQEHKVQRLLLEQIHLQKHYPSYSKSEFDHQNEKNTIQQVHGRSYGRDGGGQQHLHYSSSHAEDVQRDLQDYLYVEMQSSGLGLYHQQDQLRAKFLIKLYGTQHSVPDDETRQFGWGSINSLPAHPAGVDFGLVNYYQQQRRLFRYTQLTSEMNHILHEQQVQWVYGPISTPFNRSIAMSSGHGMDLELAQSQNIDMRCNHMNSVCQMGPVSTNVHPLQPQVHPKLQTSNNDTCERQSNGILGNSMDAFMQIQFLRDKLEAEMLSKEPSLCAQLMPAMRAQCHLWCTHFMSK